MSTQVQYRRGSAVENNAFTGALGEITVDTTAWTLRVADGATAGGYTLASLTATQTLTNKTYNGSVVSVTGNITGANLVTAGLLSVNSGNSSGTVITNAGGNGVGNIGSATGYFNTIHAKATSAQYADVAELYRADADYPVGTVLVFGGNQEVTQSEVTHSPAIAGTVSDKPAYIMNTGLQSTNRATVALLGRVPCRVTGTIRKGDLLVASTMPGVATRLMPDQYVPGCVIGKSLEDHDGDGTSMIEVVVGRL